MVLTMENQQEQQEFMQQVMQNLSAKIGEQELFIAQLQAANQVQAKKLDEFQKQLEEQNSTESGE